MTEETNLPETPKRRTIAISFSAGYDSTALLLYALQQDLDVVLHTFRLDGMTPEEIEAVDDVREFIKDRFPGRIIDHKFHSVSLAAFRTNCGQGVMMLSALPYVCEQDELWMAYVKNDCFWHWRSEYHALFENSCKIAGDRTPIVSLYIPFEWMDKKSIAHYYDAFPGLLDIIHLPLDKVKEGQYDGITGLLIRTDLMMIEDERQDVEKE